MQEINREILNPIFFLCFIGSTILLPLTVYLYRNDDARFTLLLAGTFIYIVGQFLITASQNVPLNNKLDKVNLEASSEEELLNVRNWYEDPWTRWNHFRVIAGTVALALIFLAALT